MKYLFPLLLTANLAIAGLCQGQTISWFPDHAEWCYTAHCLFDPQCGYTYYYTAGDTVLEGKSAVVVNSLYANDETQFSETDTHYFREENDTVFYYSDSSNAWGMLYDFNAQPGDVWDLTETLSGITFPYWGVVPEARIVVDSVSIEMLGGAMRRVIHTSPLYNEEEMEPESDWQFRGLIVEGIGPVGVNWSQGLFGESVALPLGGFSPSFSCYRENEALIYGSGANPCGIVSGFDEGIVFEFAVFPNPTTSYIYLQLPLEFAFRASLTIFNSVGQAVAQIENFNSLEALPMNYPPGLYVVEARNGDLVAREKVVVD